jgi:hypothetical protein
MVHPPWLVSRGTIWRIIDKPSSEGNLTQVAESTGSYRWPCVERSLEWLRENYSDLLLAAALTVAWGPKPGRRRRAGRFVPRSNLGQVFETEDGLRVW